jgi:LEA14-like dessication related protein
VVDVGVLHSTAGMSIIYYNPNNFGVTLSEARGDVYIDNKFLGRFDLGEKISVKKRSEFTVPALVKIDMIGAVMNQREIWKKKEALIRIEGIARVNKAGFTKEVPIKYESMQNLERFRGLVKL